MYLLLMFVTLLIAVPPLLFIKRGFSARHLKKVSAVKMAAIFVLCMTVFAFGFAGQASAASEDKATDSGFATGVGYLAAAVSTGLACIGAGIAVAASASAAIGASAEDPSMMGRVLIFVAMGEGVTLFGLLVSIMILGRL